MANSEAPSDDWPLKGHWYCCFITAGFQAFDC